MMKKPLGRNATIALWVLALSGWCVVLCTNETIGLKAARDTLDRAFDPPPKHVKHVVAELERFKATHYRYPLTLEEAGIQPTKDIRYIFLPGSGECQLSYALDELWDDVWTWTSWNSNWSHFRLIDLSGG